jgi:hypothetical protein
MKYLMWLVAILGVVWAAAVPLLIQQKKQMVAESNKKLTMFAEFTYAATSWDADERGDRIYITMPKQATGEFRRLGQIAQTRIDMLSRLLLVSSGVIFVLTVFLFIFTFRQGKRAA